VVFSTPAKTRRTAVVFPVPRGPRRMAFPGIPQRAGLMRKARSWHHDKRGVRGGRWDQRYRYPKRESGHDEANDAWSNLGGRFYLAGRRVGGESGRGVSGRTASLRIITYLSRTITPISGTSSLARSESIVGVAPRSTSPFNDALPDKVI